MPALRSAFTLIELLVVITIIVVLISLLAPAMDQALYRAELAVCGAQLNGWGTGLIQYATQHKRAWPHRPPMHSRNIVGWTFGHTQPTLIKQGTVPDGDLRDVIRGFIADQALIDPFCKDPGMTQVHADSHVLGPYALWFDYGFVQPPGGSTWQGRMGQHFKWDGQEYRVLVSDFDWVTPPGAAAFGTHPDADGLLHFAAVLNGEPYGPASGAADNKWTQSRWENWGRFDRGVVDTNHLFDDGSVALYDAVGRGDSPGNTDERMGKVPPATYIPDTDATNGWVNLPQD